jgi:rod shape determining protein RodA
VGWELLGKGYLQGTQSQPRFRRRATPTSRSPCWPRARVRRRGRVLALYLYYLWSGVRWRAAPAIDRRSCWWSVLAVLSFHVLYNTAMAIGLVPITGIPLPFMSYGGSFTIWSFFVTGLILGVDFRRWVNR